MASSDRSRLEHFRQDVLRDVTARGQADVQFLKTLDRYRQEIRAQALEEAARAVQSLPRKQVQRVQEQEER